MEAQDFPTAHVEAIEPKEIESFANEGGFRTTFIPAGTLFLPPEHNASNLDRLWYDPSTKQAQGGKGSDEQTSTEQGELQLARKQLEALFRRTQREEDDSDRRRGVM